MASPVTATTGEVVAIGQSISLLQSGLQNTTDTNTVDFMVTDNAGASHADSALLSYQNSGPTATTGPNIVYDANNLTRTAQGGVIDADLAVNAIVPGFESHFFDFSGGCPRMINLLADRVLISAFASKTRPVPSALVELKAKEMMARKTIALDGEGPPTPTRIGKRLR